LSSYREALERVERTLQGSSEGSAALEARWILEAATRRDRSSLVLNPTITPEEDQICTKLATRRAAGEPLQYVTRQAAFRRLNLAVGPGVFIPRPETELVAERAMARLPRGGTLVDVGTGSGAIALSVSDERPDATVIATESSPRALAWAEKNRADAGTPVELVGCDLLLGLSPSLAGSIDVIVSNPPYIDPAQKEVLPRDIVEHEPDAALFAAEQGLEVLNRLANAALSWLKPGGWLVLEIGSDQAASVQMLLATAGYEEAYVSKDLAGNDRIAEARKP
jgi:release factor glutamine methyltransferase